MTRFIVSLVLLCIATEAALVRRSIRDFVVGADGFTVENEGPEHIPARVDPKHETGYEFSRKPQLQYSGVKTAVPEGGGAPILNQAIDEGSKYGAVWTNSGPPSDAAKGLPEDVKTVEAPKETFSIGPDKDQDEYGGFGSNSGPASQAELPYSGPFLKKVNQKGSNPLENLPYIDFA